MSFVLKSTLSCRGKKFQYCLQRSVEPMERTNTFLPGTLPSTDRGERNNLGFFWEKERSLLTLVRNKPRPWWQMSMLQNWIMIHMSVCLSVCHPITKVLFSGEETGKIMRGNVFFYQTLICGTTTLDIALQIIHDFFVKFLN